MLTYILITAAVALALGVFIGGGLGYNYGMADQIPEARAILEQAEAERRRARGLAVTARRAAGDL